MPFLDVSDILSDPDFSEMISVTRTIKSAPIGGLTQSTTSTFTLTAVVQPATSDDLQRMIDVERLTGAITIYAAGPDALLASDVIAWRGRVYTIHQTDDWSQYGAGYIRALAGMTSLR